MSGEKIETAHIPHNLLFCDGFTQTSRLCIVRKGTGVLSILLRVSTVLCIMPIRMASKTIGTLHVLRVDCFLSSMRKHI